MPIPPLADFAFSFILARLIRDWIEPCCSNQFFVVVEESYVPSHLDKEVQSCFLSDAFHGSKYLHILFHFLIAKASHELHGLFRLLLKRREASCFRMRSFVGLATPTDEVAASMRVWTEEEDFLPLELEMTISTIAS